MQIKIGDIGGAEWASIHSQLIELCDSELVHPNFDKALPRIVVLVSTGRLKGKATQSAARFEEWAAKQGCRFVFWGNEVLLDLLEGNVSPGAPRLPPVYSKLALMMHADQEFEITEIIRPLCRESGAHLDSQSTVTIEILGSAELAETCFSTGRVLEAFVVGQNCIRVLALAAFRQIEIESSVVTDCLDYVSRLAERAVDLFEDVLDSPRGLAARSGTPPSTIATYPAVCLHLAGCIAWRGHWALHFGNQNEADRLLKLARMLVDHPGASRPLSNRFAGSVLVVGTFLYEMGAVDTLESWLQSLAIWISDVLEESGGFAEPFATDEETIAQLLGGPYEHMPLPQSSRAELAVAVAELAHVTKARIYEDILNDFRAVGAELSVNIPRDDLASMMLGSSGVMQLVNIQYPESTSIAPPHHQVFPRELRAPERYLPVFALLGLQFLMPDRLYLDLVARA